MLHITIPSCEKYDPVNNLFFETKATSLTLEHSLVSISKWESKWKKPFLSSERKTKEEINDYIRCMTITPNVDPMVFENIPVQVYKIITDYINDPMTATTITKQEGSGSSRAIITSELIYYWMIALGIPFECQKWHFSRLVTLIKVCQAKNQPKKKMSEYEILRQNKSLNAARRAALNSKG